MFVLTIYICLGICTSSTMGKFVVDEPFTSLAKCEAVGDEISKAIRGASVTTQARPVCHPTA